MTNDLVPVSTVSHPFKQERVTFRHIRQGLTLEQMLYSVQSDPIYRQHAVIYIGDDVVPKHLWSKIKPKHGAIVSIKIVPQGGGFARIFAFAAVAVLAVVATAFLGPLGGLAVSVIGSLAINFLLPPPTPKIAKNYGNVSETYTITNSRNKADVWGKVPFLLGQFRVVPPYAAQPIRELIGGQIYWRALFAVGHGPIIIRDIKIGNTTITQYNDVLVEIRVGYWSFNNKGYWDATLGVFPSGASFGDQYIISFTGVIAGFTYSVGETITYNAVYGEQNINSWDINQEKAFKLYGTDIYEDSFSANVVQATPIVRTSQPNADSITIDIVFDKGLVHLQNNPPGKPANSSVNIKIEQSPKGANNWTTVFIATVNGQQQNPMYWGYGWLTAKHGAQSPTKEYDVRVTRLSADYDESRNFGNFSWYSMKTETFELQYPIRGICYLAVRIKASGQLSGSLDEINVVAQSIAKTFNHSTGSWQFMPTSKPGALYRHILQHPSRLTPASDSQIDLLKLIEWDDLNDANFRYFNGVYDYKTNLWEVLIDVCRIGRAIPTLRDFIFSVVIDKPQLYPVRMFTPRNSWNYQGELIHEEIPHGYRVSFVSQDQSYVSDEIIVYNDGYSAANATRVYKIDFIGITNSTQAWKEARYHLAQQKLRREVHRITVDFEHLICERGDLVAFQHDAISVGLGSGRIISRTDDGTNVLTITADNGFFMQTGKAYAVRVRSVLSGQQFVGQFGLVTVEGEATTFTLNVPVQLSLAPQVGDLVAFGEVDLQVELLIVRDIIPKRDLTAELVLIPEAPGVHVADAGIIPDWTPRITFDFPAPTVIEIKSDASVMQVSSTRFLVERVVFFVVPSPIDGVTYKVEFKQSNTDSQFTEATIQEFGHNYVVITGIQSGITYDFRITRSHPDYLTSPAVKVNGYTVVGRSSAPQSLQNLSIASVGGQALAQWDLPDDIDVQYGGWIIFRHSPLLTGATWSNSVSIGRAVSGDQTHAYLPLKEGTYMATAYDVDSSPSPTVSFSTKQASVLTYVTEASLVEDPTFTGTKTNCEVEDDHLQLISIGGIDDSLDIDNELDFDLAGNYIIDSGLYDFSGGMDFTSVKKVRLTSHIKVEAENLLDKIDGNDNWDSADDVDGVAGIPIDAHIFGKITDDDPAGSPVWSDFLRIESMEIECRAVGELECRMTTSNPNFNIHIIELRLLAETL